MFSRWEITLTKQTLELKLESMLTVIVLEAVRYVNLASLGLTASAV